MTTTQTGAGKRTQILVAAAQVMKDSGLQGLSFEAVATKAALTRQLVRYYFADLETLMVALCDFLAKGYREMLVAGVVSVGAVERLAFFLDFFFDLAEGHPMPENLEVYDSLVAFAVGSPPLRDRMRDQYQVLGHVMVHELAIAHPDLDSGACEELSFLFVSMMHSHWSFVASLGYDRAHSRLARKAIDRLIASYRADAAFEPMLEQPWARSG